VGRPNLVESQSLTATPLLRCSFAIACAEHRWPATRGQPKLSDFREDNFLGISTEAGGTFMHLLRTGCQRDGGFEPNFLTVGNSLESLLSMVAAGRGVLLAPQIVFRYPSAGVSFHILSGAKEKFRMFLMRRKMPEPAVTVDNFIKILLQSLPRDCKPEIQDDGGKRGQRSNGVSE